MLKEIADQRPDAFVEGIDQRRFDRNGRLETVLTATSLLDFGDRANTKLTNPELRVERPPTTWHIKGGFGELTADGDRVYLFNNVIAHRHEHLKDSWKLRGETLQWDRTKSLLTSITRTTLTRGTTDSIGDEMVINLNTNESWLGNNVRTRWRSVTSSD